MQIVDGDPSIGCVGKHGNVGGGRLDEHLRVDDVTVTPSQACRVRRIGSAGHSIGIGIIDRGCGDRVGAGRAAQSYRRKVKIVICNGSVADDPPDFVACKPGRRLPRRIIASLVV